MEEIVPTEFQLIQNYPDPFRERITIKYCVPDKMKIMLECFDSDKNKVKTLINEIKEAGTFKWSLIQKDYQVVFISTVFKQGVMLKRRRWC